MSEQDASLPEDPQRARESARRRNSVVLVAVAAVLCVLAVVLALGALRGGGGDPPAAEPGGAPASTAAASGAEPADEQLADQQLADEQLADDGDRVAFSSPTGNIGCVLSSAGARCDIDERDWDPPAQPDDCSGQWGDGLQLGPAGASVSCATDDALGAEEVLGYGETLGRGEYRCTSRESGMSCDDLQDGASFVLSRRAYSTS